MTPKSGSPESAAKPRVPSGTPWPNLALLAHWELASARAVVTIALPLVAGYFSIWAGLLDSLLRHPLSATSGRRSLFYAFNGRDLPADR